MYQILNILLKIYNFNNSYVMCIIHSKYANAPTIAKLSNHHTIPVKHLFEPKELYKEYYSTLHKQVRVELERFLTQMFHVINLYFAPLQLGKPSKEKTGNILVFYQYGVPPLPPLARIGNFRFFLRLFYFILSDTH